MWKWPLRLSGFIWRRLGDSALLAWLFPSAWGSVMSGAVATIVAVAGFIEGLDPVVWIFLALGALLLSLCCAHLWLFLSRRLGWQRESSDGQWVPLPDAMRRVHEATLDTAIAEFARGSSESPEDVLNWYAFWATQKSEALPIYGKRPPSQKLELIPRDEFRRCHFINGAKELKAMYEKRPVYTELAVKRDDLERCWKALISYE